MVPRRRPAGLRPRRDRRGVRRRRPASWSSCNPHNPLGRVFTAERAAGRWPRSSSGHGARVFSDEIHAPLVYPGAGTGPYASLSAVTAGHTITATSASKAWNLPGLKCAQLVLVQRRRRRDLGRGRAPSGARRLHPRGPRQHRGLRRGRAVAGGVLGYLDGNRRLLADLLAEHLPAGPLHARRRAPTWPGWTAGGWASRAAPGEFFLDQAGVALVDGPGVRRGGRGHVRLNLATPRPVLTTDRRADGAAARSLRPAAGGGPEGDNGPGGRPY